MLEADKKYRENPALGSTDIKNLLDSPYRFKEGREFKEYKECYDFGTAFHLRCLGNLDAYKQNVIFADVKTETMNSKEGREFIKAHPEKIIVHRSKERVIEDMYSALMS